MKRKQTNCLTLGKRESQGHEMFKVYKAAGQGVGRLKPKLGRGAVEKQAFPRGKDLDPHL